MCDRIRQNHDKFLKSILSDKEAAQEFFNAFLPDSVKTVLDVSRIEHIPGTFISSYLKATHADMLFSCPLITETGDPEMYLCLIVVEHKSNPYKYSAIQLGGYMFDAYRQQVDEGIDPLRIVLPFLYYHGGETWTPPEIVELLSYAPQDLQAYLPKFELIFKNIQQYSDDEIRQLGTHLFTSAILAQKYGQDPEELKIRINQIFAIIDSWEGRNLFESLTVYVLDILEINMQELHVLIEKIPNKMKTEILSLADRLRAEGREESKYLMVHRLLLKNADIDFICEVADVSKEYVLKVQEEFQGNN